LNIVAFLQKTLELKLVLFGCFAFAPVKLCYSAVKKDYGRCTIAWKVFKKTTYSKKILSQIFQERVHPYIFSKLSGHHGAFSAKCMARINIMVHINCGVYHTTISARGKTLEQLYDQLAGL